MHPRSLISLRPSRRANVQILVRDFAVSRRVASRCVFFRRRRIKTDSIKKLVEAFILELASHWKAEKPGSSKVLGVGKVFVPFPTKKVRGKGLCFCFSPAERKNAAGHDLVYCFPSGVYALCVLAIYCAEAHVPLLGN